MIIQQLEVNRNAGLCAVSSKGNTSNRGVLSRRQSLYISTPPEKRCESKLASWPLYELYCTRLRMNCIAPVVWEIGWTVAILPCVVHRFT
jgi:hypothetical protein